MMRLPPRTPPTATLVTYTALFRTISGDGEAATAVNRRSLHHSLEVPNYRNYWREAGYVEEMDAVEKAIATGDTARIPDMMGDRWLDDVTLFGPAKREIGRAHV